MPPCAIQTEVPFEQPESGVRTVRLSSPAWAREQAGKA